jgi:hypothetical protein
MLRRFGSVMAGGALALTSYAVMAGAPASAQPIELFLPNKIEVTKVVEGQNKGVGYEVVVQCQRRDDEMAASLVDGGKVFSKTLVFGPDGGEKEVRAPFGATCTVIETHNGGATRTEVTGSPCEFNTEEQASADAVRRIEGETCEVTVTNIFDPKPAPLPGPPGPPGPEGPAGAAGAAGAAGVSATTQASAAQAVVGTARFTG